MEKLKHVIRYSFVIFTLLISIGGSSFAMEGEDENYDDYTTPNAPLIDISLNNEDRQPLQSEEEQNLSAYFHDVIVRTNLPSTCKQIGSGMFGVVSSFFSLEVLIPVGIKTLEWFGVTKDVIPSTGTATILYAIAVAIPPFCAGVSAAYGWAIEKRSKKPCSSCYQRNRPLTEEEQVTQLPPSKIRSFIYSWPVQTIQTLFYDGIALALFIPVESHLDSSWGNSYGWAGAFTILAAPLIYFTIVDSTNNSNLLRFPWRTLPAQSTIEKITDAQNVIKNKGFTNEVTKLGANMNITFLNPQNYQAVGNLIPGIPYRKVLENINKLSSELPSCIQSWNRFAEWASKYISWGIQIGGAPTRCLLTYGLPYRGLTALGVPSDVAFYTSLGFSIVVSPFVVTSSVKELPLVQKEYEQVFKILEPDTGCGYIGQRIAPLIGRAINLIYVTLPMAFVVKTTLSAIGLGEEADAALTILFCAGTPWAAGSQFFDKGMTDISNWVATLPCCWNQAGRKNALLVSYKLIKFKEKVTNINRQYALILQNNNNNLLINIEKQKKEEEIARENDQISETVAIQAVIQDNAREMGIPLNPKKKDKKEKNDDDDNL